MKREKRESFMVVAEVGGLGLCNFCHYAGFSGSWCNAELECEHPLPAINEGECWEVWAGGRDCWGFRNNMTLQEAGVIASIAAQGMIPEPHRTLKHEWVGIVTEAQS